MDTVRVDICYRPLRIAWAISAGDIDAFRSAARLSTALWGGRFNPIVILENEEESAQLIDAFRVDVIYPLGNSEVVKDFPKRFPHLINPWYSDELFVNGGPGQTYAQVLDIQNLLVHVRDNPEWKMTKEKGIRIWTWQPDDPLANVLLVQLGAYPNPTETGIDYRKMLMQAADATETAIDPASAIPVETLDHPTIGYLSRYGLERHYSLQSVAWDHPGFFSGDSTNCEDLVCHWNLRAADIPLWFVDPNYLPRYSSLIPEYEKRMRQLVSHRMHEIDRQVAVWFRCAETEETEGRIEAARKSIGDLHLMPCPVSMFLWNGLNLRPPMMYLEEVSALGVIGREGGKPRISFPLNEKPFSGDNWFHSQHLVASVSFIGGLYGDEQYTLHPPFIPELNEFYARTMHFEYSKLRIGSERIGLVIDAADKDSFINALPVADLIEKIFDNAGFSTELSNGGLILRQLIRQLGGLQGARVFKIPGVRRLLKTHGPTATFSRNEALQLIGSRDPANPDAKFTDHEGLYIEQREWGSKLEPNAVFGYLLEKGLFRIGKKLQCPACRMASWISVDSLKHRVECEMCGYEHEVARQLVDGGWDYRRSGVLGAEKNAQGAVPVALTLQQLQIALHAHFDGIYSASLKLTPKDSQPECEIDLIWLIPRPYRRRTAVILGECKDQGPVPLQEFENDINTLKRVADALPEKRFETFVLLSKLAPFTKDEIELAKTLNDRYRQRAILLTARELEPYHIYDRVRAEVGIKNYGSTPEDLAQTTAQLYFKESGTATAGS